MSLALLTVAWNRYCQHGAACNPEADGWRFTILELDVFPLRAPEPNSFVPQLSSLSIPHLGASLPHGLRASSISRHGCIRALASQKSNLAVVSDRLGSSAVASQKHRLYHEDGLTLKQPLKMTPSLTRSKSNHRLLHTVTDEDWAEIAGLLRQGAACVPPTSARRVRRTINRTSCELWRSRWQVLEAVIGENSVQ